MEQNINLHIRGGYAVATHFKTALTIDETRKNNGFQIVAALDEHQEAHGDLYLDDGKSLIVENQMTVQFDFTYENITISRNEQKKFCEYKKVWNQGINTVLESVKVYGIIEKPLGALVTVWQGPTMDGLKEKGKLKEPNVKYQNNFGVLSIDTGSLIDLCDTEGEFFMIAWTYEQMDVQNIN